MRNIQELRNLRFRVSTVSKLSTDEKNSLAERYLPMVYIVAKDIADRIPVHIDFDDLVSAGQYGLFQALERYEDGREVRFITFAKHRIKGAILDELRNLDPVGRLTRQRARRLDEATQRLRCELGREPEAHEVDKLVPLKKKQKDRAQQLPFVLSLEQPGVAYETRQVADPLDNVHEMVSRKQQADRLQQAIAQLPDKSRKALDLYYEEELTLGQMAKKMRVKHNQAIQMRTAALESLRQILTGDQPSQQQQEQPIAA